MGIVFKTIILSVLFTLNIISSSHSNEPCREKDSLETLSDKANAYVDEENYKEVFNCSFILSEIHNDVDGLSWLGYLYYEGLGVNVDLEKSFEYSLLASEKGDPFATYDLGADHYFGGNPTVPTDYEKSFEKLYEAYYELSHFDALGSLVLLYYYGIGTEKDYQKSFELLSRYDLEMLGDFEKLLFAEHLIRGVGTEQNIELGVSILDSLSENDYIFADYELNILFGKDYLNKEARELKSLYFYQKERDSYMPFGYKGYEIQEEIALLMNKEKKYLQAANRSLDVIKEHLNNSNTKMTFEICYAIGNLGHMFNNHDVYPESFSKKLYEYNEYAYQKGCSGQASANLVNSIIWDTDDPDYQKAYDLCLNDIKISAQSTDCISYIALFYKDSIIFDYDPFVSYILFTFAIENAEVSLDTDLEWDQNHRDDLMKDLTRDQIHEANLIVQEINNDFTKIFPFLEGSAYQTYTETLEVNKFETEEVNEDIIPDYQKEILTTRSKNEISNTATISDNSPPEIVINESIEINGDVANLEFSVFDNSNIEAIFIDDDPVRINESNNGEVKVSFSIFIGDKKKEITITAYDKWGQSGQENLELEKTRETFNINYGDYYALVIGNNEYEYLPQLNTAVNDASVISKILKNKYNFKEVVLLTDATRKEILSELYKFKNKLSFKDNFLIYYAGHGDIDRQLGEGYWQPVNAEPNLPIEWIENKTITSIISSMKSKHILVISDSCYSGLLTRGGNQQLGQSYGSREIFLQRMNDKKSRLVLTSGGKEPVQDGGGGNHSIFAKSLIQILEDNSIEITVSEISKKITSNVILNSDQTPEFSPLHKSGHDGGEFIFVPSI